MATKRQKIEVGVFLVAAFVLLAVVLVYLAGLRQKEYHYYHITFRESVPGLSVGSKVTYRGIPIGKITKLRVDERNYIAVTIGVEPEKVILREGVRAKYSAETLFGPFTIDLARPEGGRPDPLPLPPGAHILVEHSLLSEIERKLPATLESIRSSSADLKEIIGSVKPEEVQKITQEAHELVTRVNQVVGEINDISTRLRRILEIVPPEDIAQIVTNVRSLTANIDHSISALRKDITEFTDATEGAYERILLELSGLNDAVKTSLGKLDKQLADVKLPETGEAVRQTVAKIGTAADSITEASRAIARRSDRMGRALDNVENSLLASLDELEQVLKATRALLQTIERDPSSLTRGKR